MAPAVFFVDPTDQPDAQGVLTLSGDEARHAAQVSRLRVGEPVHLVDGAGRRFEGEIASASRDRVDVRIARTSLEPDPQPRLIVIQALAKGDRGELAVAAMTEVGVDVIVPWSAERCVTRWVGDKVRRGVDKWRATARASTKQARRSRVPVVEGLHSTIELQTWISSASLALCLDESTDHALAAMAMPQAGDITLIVGPEGGISDSERDRLVNFGARLARLGPSVLRTSTAGPVAAAVVLSRTDRWRGSA